jgi:hypothetical protein
MISFTLITKCVLMCLVLENSYISILQSKDGLSCFLSKLPTRYPHARPNRHSVPVILIPFHSSPTRPNVKRSEMVTKMHGVRVNPVSTSFIFFVPPVVNVQPDCKQGYFLQLNRGAAI